ncbi:MAG: hypothetical protein COU06_00615 [Candidatus Harrisonbacteria bacterium CG10_big_fil_rev_8_21_14_0_10_38_8]|uniref:LTD domain-containing protein n=1 Tax=Candidatus Harrisonbacteria bacterium CG10_big_fil_rev_8_21_14_0_10_38_8 TaxID=1974582 RepID=A0A2M6WKN2_9BACT|nr:MAG: hypothetical protein COU06_00615 [Candidatus Harrisonbacteria bacterium CG10_big_fil_rev_8_21_14_0_10_38_8]
MKISKVLPNPIGVDKGNEYIVLVNRGESVDNLSSYLLKDKTGKTHSLPKITVLENQEVFVYPSFSINNSAEEIYLIKNGVVVDYLGYQASVKEGEYVLHDSKISEELRLELFDELAIPLKETLQLSPTSVFLNGVITALVVTSIFFIYEKNKK